jgi:acetylornithine deacetylase
MTDRVATAKELLARLVGFDTVSDQSNLALIDFVAGYLRQFGIESARVPTADGRKASLFATLGAAETRGIALSGHTDVVPVDGQDWASDPFALRERDGKLYGRGTCDMKGYLACVLAAVPDLVARKLKIPFHVVFSYDEEVGCTGVRPMIAEMGTRLTLPRMVFVGEPTNMAVVDAHKGPIRWRVELTGKAAHSSMPHYGVNAISYAGRLLAEIGRMEAELKAMPPDDRFDPPWTSLQVTRIEGGTASNIVPVPCWFAWEVRALPDFDPDTLDQRLRTFAVAGCLPEMRAVAPEADIKITVTNRTPAFQADPSSPAVRLALELARQSRTFAVSFATEAGLFQAAGAPAVVCGPGNIAQAHTPDEFVEVDELGKCLAFLERLGDWASG